MKNIDKLLFLKNNIPDKEFYLVNCMVYHDGGHICHRNNGSDNQGHAKLVDTANIVRPQEDNVLSQDEYLCEESKERNVACDLNRYVPYISGLKQKEPIISDDKILLKTGTYLVTLKYTCVGSWCGYVGNYSQTRRAYNPPGGSIYRCYYAKQQQICKELYPSGKRSVYNERDWLST
ncbi:unnamed protein product [Leptidea sinapis]|uniref:Uncharacterized protein n=1 Tax=Leptidea sinapis TaxID=189913 RepID=A0A5E4QIW6_9NEOP|nr:unnamed protein product [Leptidea sinapis]